MFVDEFELGPELGTLVDRIVDSYDTHERTRHIERVYLPNKAATIELCHRLLELLYPGFIGRQRLDRHNVAFHVGDLLPRIGSLAFQQVHNCLCYLAESEDPTQAAQGTCAKRSRELTLSFLQEIPRIRDVLCTDVDAAYDGDPAALNFDEIILAYPGLMAISIHRLAHCLHRLGVPLMPRIMNEWVHANTGIDIHPGANIGERFFIDHGTGVVIGETTDIGNNVKVYQGVTLGALSFPKDERGRIIREAKRHPTVEHNVTIYANAIILGGDTVIGEGAVIGGSVFVTSSVPPDSVVTFKPPELRVKSRSAESDRKPAPPPQTEDMPDYVI